MYKSTLLFGAGIVAIAPVLAAASLPAAIQQSGTWYTYGLDLPKNVTELYGTNGYIVTAYTYTPYGLVTATGSVTQHIQWSSEYVDTDLGLVYYNYRHYNPLDGRWTGRDAVMTSNLYIFSKNRAQCIWDLLGNCSLSDEPIKYEVSEKTCKITLIIYYSHMGDKTTIDTALEGIYKYWNQENTGDKYVLVPKKTNSKRCCKCKSGFKMRVRLKEVAYGKGNISITSTRLHDKHIQKDKELQSHAYPMADVVNEIKLESEVVGIMNLFYYENVYSPEEFMRTAAHEFGHSLGLPHPGMGIGSNKNSNSGSLTNISYIPQPKIDIKPQIHIDPPSDSFAYIYRGKDIYGRDVDGTTDLMGSGENMRDFYFKEWASRLNKKYPDCSYKVAERK